MIIDRLKKLQSNTLITREIFVSLIIVALLLFLFITRGMPIILTIFIDFAIFAIITMSLNLETGYTGVPQFGRVAAVIVGAFAVGAIPGRLMAIFMGLPWGVEYASDLSLIHISEPTRPY